MKKKLHLHALALAAMLAASSAAMATAAQGPGTVTLTNTTGHTWSAAIGNTPVLGDFTDVYNFVPDATPGSVAWGSLINTSLFGVGNIHFTSADLNGTALFTLPLPGIPVSYNFATLLPAHFSGPLTLTVHGINAGGSYGGDLTVNMAPVPEPETYGMMLAGFGILAMLARRRKQD